MEDQPLTILQKMQAAEDMIAGVLRGISEELVR